MQLILARLHGSVRRLFEITRLDQAFEIRARFGAVGSFDGAQARRLTIELWPTAVPS